MNEQERLVGIFSEHCGYLCFTMMALKVTELKGDNVVIRHV